MKRPPNTPIGEVECIQKGCSKTCKVYRFRERTPGRKSVFSGRLYLECPDHGRIGTDPKPATQDYILEHAKMYGPGAPAPKPEKSGTAPAPASATAIPKGPDSKPAPKPATDPAPAASRSFWAPLIKV